MKELKIKENDIEIKETKLANTDRGILWVDLNQEQIKMLRTQAYRVKNKTIILITYIPSIFWVKKCRIIEHCKREQSKNPHFRYQIRLGKSDIELWTKNVQDFFIQKTPLNAFGDVTMDIQTSTIQQRYTQGTNKRMRSSSPPNTNKKQNTDIMIEEDVEFEDMIDKAMDAAQPEPTM